MKTYLKQQGAILVMLLAFSCTTTSIDNEPAESTLGPEVLNSITTAALGWVANTDVTDQFITYLETAEAGDELCLSAMYKLRSEGIQLPDYFTLCAVEGGGFSLIDVQNSNSAYLKIGDFSLWNNVTIKDEAPLAAESVVRTNNKNSVLIEGGHTIAIVNCSFSANTKTHLDIRGVENLTIKGTHFNYGYYQMLLRAYSNTILIEDCLFSNSYGDGIKTSRAGVEGVVNMTVINTVYEDNLRDGIDTTGGFRNGVVTECIFRRNGVSGLDIKSIYENPNDVGEGSRGNDNIVISDSEFIDQNNAVVLTTIDRTDDHLINDSNADYHLPNNIMLQNSIIENNGTNTPNVFLIKDAHSISWDGLQLLGTVNLERTFGPRDYPNYNYHLTRPIISETNYNISGSNVTEGLSRGSNSNYPFADVGPR